MLVCIAPLSACCHLDQPNYLCNCRLVLHAVPCGRQRTLAHAPCHSSCTCCTQRRFMMGCIPPWAILARYTTLSNLCFMHFCCSLPGGSAPRGPTYSTVLEHHTGISARCDDQHVFFVHMGDSLQEKSCRTSPEHLKLNRHPICSGSPPPYSRENNGKKKKNSEIRVTGFDADSGPARAGASAHIPNPVTPIPRTHSLSRLKCMVLLALDLPF